MKLVEYREGTEDPVIQIGKKKTAQVQRFYKQFNISRYFFFQNEKINKRNRKLRTSEHEGKWKKEKTAYKISTHRRRNPGG
jgi:hypothetical protein